MYENKQGELAEPLNMACFFLQIIHLKRFQFVNGHWVKSNKIVKFPMEGFDPSAFLTKQTLNTNSSLSNSDSGVTTVNVRSSEEQDAEEETGVNREETGENREQTSRQGSEVILYLPGWPC